MTVPGGCARIAEAEWKRVERKKRGLAIVLHSGSYDRLGITTFLSETAEDQALFV